MRHLHPRVRDTLKVNQIFVLMKVLLNVSGAFFCGFLGRNLYWQLLGVLNGDPGAFESCATCICDCVGVQFEGSLPEPVADLKDFILANCGRDDPDMQKELKKSRIQQLQEEMTLLETVSMEDQKKIDAAMIKADSKATLRSEASQECYLKMQTSEGARERAEADLATQKKITNLWESRARALGWKDEQEGDSLG